MLLDVQDSEEDMQRFTDLKVWQRGHALALAIYRLSAAFPSDERFGLVAQLRRAMVSVPTTIAEGSRRRSAKDYAHFLNIAEASLAEVEYLLMLSRDLGYLDESTATKDINEATEISRMLYALRCKVEADNADV